MVAIRSLETLKAEAAAESVLKGFGMPGSWTDGKWFGGSAWANLPSGRIVSVMVDPPEGVGYINLPGNGHGKPPADIEEDDFDQTVLEYTDSLPAPANETAGMKITVRGVKFTGPVHLDNWLKVVNGWLVIAKAHRAIIADLLNYGETRYGENYAQAYVIAKELNLSPDTILQWRRVYAKIPYDIRPDNLSYTAARMLAYRPPEQLGSGIEYYLDGHNTDETREHLDAETAPLPDVLLSSDQVAQEPPPPCPICGAAPGRTRCGTCDTDFTDLSWHIHNLNGEVRGFFETGEIGPMMLALKGE